MMPKSSNLANQIEAAMAADTRFHVDPIGHSEYLLRYRTATGIPFAIGRTAASGVRVWIAADEGHRTALEGMGFTCTRSEPLPPVEGRRATGRNSNLDQIREFKNVPLYWAVVTTPGEALKAATALR